VLIRDGDGSRSVTVNIPIIAASRRSRAPAALVAVAMAVGGLAAVVHRHQAAPAVASEPEDDEGADVTATAGPSRAALAANRKSARMLGDGGVERGHSPSAARHARPAWLPPLIIEEVPGPPPARPAVSSRWYEGAEGYPRAVEEQKKTRGSLLVYFRADWCSYCRTMDQEVLAAPAVARYLDQVVKVRVSPESGPADQALMKSFGAHTFPAVFMIPAPQATAEPVSDFTRSGNERMTLNPEKFVKACEEVGLTQARGLVRDGVAKTRARDYAGARADLERALEIDPRNAEAFFWRGYDEEHVGAIGKAAGNFRRALELDPKDPRPYAELARLYGSNRQFEDAIGTLDHLIEVAPDWQKGLAFAMRGLAQGENGNSAGAAADHAEACRRGHRPSCAARTTFQRSSVSRDQP
jgi:tetratricopeptide (TPR) repeat protein